MIIPASTIQTKVPKQPAPPVEEPVAEEQGFQPVKAEESFEKAEDTHYHVRLPKKKAISAGLGGAAGLGLGLFFGGGIGAIAAAMAIGGTSGVAVSSETASNLWGKAKGAYHNYKEKRAEAKRQVRLDKESGEKANLLFAEKLRQVEDKSFSLRWAQQGLAAVDERSSKRIQEKVEAGLDGAVAQRVEAEVDQAADQRFDGQWAKRGTKLLQQEVGKRIEKHLQLAISSDVESETEARFSEAVEAGVARSLRERKEEISSNVELKARTHLKDIQREESRGAVVLSLSYAKHRKLAETCGVESIKAAHLADALTAAATDESLHPTDRMLASEVMTNADLSSEQTIGRLEQAAFLLDASTEDKAATLDPTKYVEACRLRMAAPLEEDIAIHRAGLKALLEHGQITRAERRLCKQGLELSPKIRYTMDRATYLRDIFRFMAGEIESAPSKKEILGQVELQRDISFGSSSSYKRFQRENRFRARGR